MKGIVITPEKQVSVRDFSDTQPLYQAVGEAVGGYIEVVNPKGLPKPFCMIVNGEGRLQNLPFNPIGSFRYGTQRHGQPVMGTVVIMKEALNEDRERDIFGLTEFEIAMLKKHIETAKASRLPEEPKNPPPAAQVIEIPPDVDVGMFLDMIFGNYDARK